MLLPKSSESSFAFPRGKFRTKLGSKGLIGKIRLNSSMSVREVEDEICSVFRVPMGDNDDFSFKYLQSTGVGTRTLTIPSVSVWTAQQVAKLGNSKQAIYILANDELACSLESEMCPS